MLSLATCFAVLTGTALAWFILFMIGLAVFLWFLSWLLFPEAKPIPVGDSLRGLDGMNETMAGKLATFGVRSDHDLVRLTPRGQQELESQLGLHQGEYDRWKQQVLDRWRERYLPESFRGIRDITPDPEIGGVYAKKPKEQDDLTKVPGIDKLTASRMNHAGVYTYEQLRLMSPEQQACFKNKFNLSGFDFTKVPDYGVTAEWLAFLRENPSEQGKRTDGGLLKATPSDSAKVADSKIVSDSFQSSNALRSASSDTASIESGGGTATPDASPSAAAADIPTSRVDSELGRVYTSPPPHRDDLTQLNGIDAATAKRLNESGIYTTSQVMSLTPSQRASFKRRFDLPHFDFTQWSSSKLPSGSGSGPHFKTPSTPSKDAASVGEEKSGATTAGASQASGSGTQYASSATGGEQPKVTGFATGTGDAKQDSSNPRSASGTTASSASSTTQGSSVSGFAAAAAVAGAGAGMAASSATSHSSTERFTPSTKIPSASELGYHVDDKLGRVYTSRPAEADDLKRLPGIDAEKEKQLNEAGIYTYKQLEDMSLAQQAELRSRFGLESASFDEWRRMFYAWSRGLSPESADIPAKVEQTGWLHSVRLSSVAPGVFDGQKLVAYPEQVIYRGTDPVQWGTSVSTPREGVEKSVHSNDIRTDINYVRIRRLDTRESVVTEVKKSELFSPGPASRNGWNGLCERFFGAHHLGVYASSIPAEAETKFGVGGWGFGHQVDQNDEQEYCWNGRLIAPTAFEISVGRVGVNPGTVVFRSNDPTIWNLSVSDGTDRFAIPVDSVTHPISFVRILRVDTGEAVIVRCDKANVTCRGENPRVGWNGLNEHFLGGHHLGVYHRDAPQDVEIAYGEGGWGFGHPFNDNDRQAYGWGGSAMSESVFEISVLEKLPENLRSELMES